MFKVKDETKLSSLASINKLVYFANAANDIYDDPYLLYNYMETIKKTENGEIVEERIMRNGKAYFNHAPKVTLKYAYDGIDTDIKVGSFTSLSLTRTASLSQVRPLRLTIRQKQPTPKVRQASIFLTASTQ